MKLKSKIGFALIVLFCSSMLCPLQAYAVYPPKIYLVPSQISTDQKWNAEVLIKEIPAADAVYAYQVKLYYNTTFLQFLGARIPETDKSWIFQGLTTVPPLSANNTEIGYAVVGVSILKGLSVSGTGPFALASFNFAIKAQLKDTPASYVNVDNADTFLVNDEPKKVPAKIEGEGSVNCVISTADTSPQEAIDSYYTHSSGNYAGIGVRDLISQKENPVELIIGLNNQVPSAYAQVETAAAKHNSQVNDRVQADGKTIAVAVNVPADQTESFILDVKATGVSTYVEPSHQFKASWTPNDPYWQYQWGPKNIQADWAWNTTVGNSSVLIAIVDTGIDYTHPDLAANYVALGYNWVNNTRDCRDDNGHGTHVAGIIAAKLNNSIGIAGTAQVRIMAEKVLNPLGKGSDTWIANGIYNATAAGAKIISMSLGGYRYSQTIYNAIKYAYDNGVLLVAAAGNDATSGTDFPAYFDEVVAVTATNQSGTPASFTDFGPWVELAAPGVNIYSTMPTYHVTMNDEGVKMNYDYLNGTSMATPFVSAVAGLIWSRFPTLTRDQVRIHLRKTADDLGTPGFDVYYGYGRINAKKAVDQSPPQHDLVILNWKRTPYVKMGNVTVNATITNYGMSNENNVVAQLWLNGSLSASKSITSMASGQSATVSLSSPASGSGVYNVTVRAVPVSGETDTNDNTVQGYVGTQPGTIKVPDYYSTIQQAVDVAVSGDTVRVGSGTYNEQVRLGTSNMSLIGQSPQTTVINGGGRPLPSIPGVAYTDGANSVTIGGFTLQHSGGSGSAGIRLVGSGYCIVSNNTISHNAYGIYLTDSYCNIITGNTVTFSDGVGIELVGIIIDYGNLVGNNTVQASASAGIVQFASREGDTISGNVVQNNGDDGIFVSQNCLVTGNKVVQNALSGISLYGGGITVRDNYFRGNGYGIDIRGATGNSIYQNNFINNTYQVYGTEANSWYGRWNATGNYWSGYQGSDTDADGIGNTPYVINTNNVDNFPFMNPYLPGDVNHDGKVDILDIAFIGKYNGYTVNNGSTLRVKRADLNEDAIVNTLDLNIAYANFNKTWQSYWGE